MQARRSLVEIFLLSALILFVEMLLIRWVSTELRVFAYVQNGVLVAAFLGLGLGSRNSRLPVRLLPAAVALALTVLVVRDPFGWDTGEAVTQGLVAFGDSDVWFSAAGQGANYLRVPLIAYALGITLGLLWAVAQTFYPLGQWLGRWMDASPRPIAAYTSNLLGSLAGIALFDAATLARTPPWIWFLFAGPCLALLALRADDRKPLRWAAAALLAAAPLLAWSATRFPTVWSPYQKLALQPLTATLPWNNQTVVCGPSITVNQASYQALVDLDPARLAARPDVYPPVNVRTSHYILPHELIGQREKVLVVGSGAGNDVAAALRAGAGSVHAVEIDPVILDWGRQYHPNKPYASDRVRVTVDDARAFFRRDRDRYDLIWFGLLDSHTTPSAYANVRLDHFVYTRESFADMKKLLAPGGVVVLFFDPQTQWIAERLSRLMHETFGAAPVGLQFRPRPCLGWGGLMLIGGSPQTLAAVRARAAAEPLVAGGLLPEKIWNEDTVVTTDNWPYLYLPGRQIPRYHLLIGGIALVIGLILRRRLFRPGEDLNLPMLLLGAGFMLLEVSGVSLAALLFGTTWTVNAYVVGAILAMALLANLTASRVRIDPSGWPFGGLVITLIALAVVPTSWLAGLPEGLRIVAGGIFFALPVYFSGLIFVSLWARSERKDLALGSNLLGSLVGGVASMLTMALGFQAIVFLTLAIYLGALLLIRRGGGAAPAALPAS